MKRARKLTLPTFLMMSLWLNVGCNPATPNSADALADATRGQRADLAACVAAGGNCVLETQALIATLDAGFN